MGRDVGGAEPRCLSGQILATFGSSICGAIFMEGVGWHSSCCSVFLDPVSKYSLTPLRKGPVLMPGRAANGGPRRER
jgi:hypothetical protein